MRSAAYNRFGVLMGTSSRASSPRWLSLRGNSLPMITLISSQGDFCATACGGKENIEMHHVRHLRDLNKKGKREMPPWMQVMISRKRKSIPLCRRCHDDVHYNRPKLK